MGDKSPKSKERKKNQQKAAKSKEIASAKAKQDGQSRGAPGKDKRER